MPEYLPIARIHNFRKSITIGQMSEVFANGLGDQSSIPGRRLKNWYLMPPCLILSIIRYGSRVKLSNPGNGVAPSPTPRYSSYRKGAFESPSTKVANFLYFNMLTTSPWIWTRVVGSILNKNNRYATNTTK